MVFATWIENASTRDHAIALSFRSLFGWSRAMNADAAFELKFVFRRTLGGVQQESKRNLHIENRYSMGRCALGTADTTLRRAA